MQLKIRPTKNKHFTEFDKEHFYVLIMILEGLIIAGLATHMALENHNEVKKVIKNDVINAQPLTPNNYLSLYDLINSSRSGIGTDKQTGVEYYVKATPNNVAITPRLKKNGDPYVNPKWHPQKTRKKH